MLHEKQQSEKFVFPVPPYPPLTPNLGPDQRGLEFGSGFAADHTDLVRIESALQRISFAPLLLNV